MIKEKKLDVPKPPAALITVLEPTKEPKKWPILALMIGLLAVLLIVMLKSQPTGFTVSDEIAKLPSYAQKLNIKASENAEYTLILEEAKGKNFTIKALTVSGSYNGTEIDVKVWLEDSKNRYLILNGKALNAIKRKTIEKELEQARITGMAIDENEQSEEEQPAEETPTDEQLPSNEIEPNAIETNENTSDEIAEQNVAEENITIKETNETLQNETINETFEQFTINFSDICVETCNLNLSDFEYKLIVEIGSGQLQLDEIKYWVEGNIAFEIEPELIEDDPKFKVIIDSAEYNNETQTLTVVFHHNYERKLPIFIETENALNYELSQNTSSGSESVTLIVYNWNPESAEQYFEIKVGKESEVIGFGKVPEYSFSVEIKDAKNKSLEADIKFLKENLKQQGKASDKILKLKKGNYNIAIKPTAHPVKEIVLEGVNIKNDSVQFIRLDDVNETDELAGYIEVYAIDASALNFTEATVTATAKGTTLYKCKSWNFNMQICESICGFDEQKQAEVCHSGWQKLMDIVPGQEYSFILTPEDPAYAEYNSTLGAPQCKTPDSPCIANSSLLQCNDNQAAPGPEPNQPNTIDACTDSTTSGTCHYDESIENITITSLNSSYFRPGDMINVTFWAYCRATTDRIALYYTNSTSSISWQNKLAGTTRCAGSGYRSRTVTFVLNNISGEHAVRAITLYNANINSACPTGNYRDQDDVAFRVAAPPNVSLNIPPPNYYNDSAPQVNVTFNCSVTADVPLTNISLYITNASNQSFSLNQTTNISGTTNSSQWTLTLGVGNYTWNCLAYDNASQSDWGDANRTLQLNYSAPPNTAPQIILNQPANDTQFNNTQSVNFNFTAIDDYNTTLNCSIYLDAVLNQTNSSTQNNTLTNFLINGISYGSHNWFVNCTDGSLSNVSETRYFSIADTQAPSVFDLKPVAGTTYDTGTTIEIAANVTDNVAVGTVRANITYPNSTATILTLNNAVGAKYNNSFTIPALAGQYNVTIIANDSSSNINDTEKTYFIAQLPNTAPQINLNLPANNTQFNNTQDINFNFTATDDYNTTLSCSIYLDAVLNQTNGSVQNNTLTNFLINGISYGSHNWSINCSDGSLSSVSETRYFSIADTITPNIYYNPNTDASGTYSKSWIFVNITCSDLHKDTVILNWNGTNESFDNSAGDVYWENKTGLADGSYSFYAWCNDSYGNTNQTVVRSVTIDASSPTYSNDSDDSRGSVVEGTIVNISVQWNDNIALHTAIFRNNETGTWANVSTCTLSGTSQWCNRTIDTAGDAGKVICWNQYANDSVGNLNDSMPSHCFNVIPVKKISPGGARIISKKVCTENWSCSEWGECIDGIQNRTCKDLNDCGTTKNKPEEVRPCCVENWSCSEWSECIDGIQNRTCKDLNVCGTELEKPVESRECASCFDGIQNQGEEGIDCGGPCEPCKLGLLSLVGKTFGKFTQLGRAIVKFFKPERKPWTKLATLSALIAIAVIALVKLKALMKRKKQERSGKG